ncbi:MAG: exonuclease [Elusimicrobia bacterium RIFOXYA12_FULL_51_18]|nr:MAG: exonuclease [Elusimicrobia bacterium RIFOXYA12_FULL_51_18]OGS28645.1 MAG: exonuclease [Elusimicrobia bacterium RIFOXYA2_FULL_53_38]
MSAFVAIDFETADYGRDSACSVGLVRVEDNKIVRSEHHLIRPPRQTFVFTEIHGLTWADVKKAPTFGQLWNKMDEFFKGAEFFVAHNASFDKGVLHACCTQAGVSIPKQPFRCTVKLARKVLKISPAKLSHVCHHLSIPLKHHNALSDAAACAQIMITVLQTEAEEQE